MNKKLKITNLKTEYKTNPIGISNPNPRLSWEIISDLSNCKQTAYQIQVAFSEESLKNNKNIFWDSGKVNSDQSIHLEYEGPSLKTGQRVYWHVKVWDNKDNESDWSSTIFWEMGILNISEWVASWIEPDMNENVSVSTPCPYLRKEFELTKNIITARVYVSSLGLYQLNLNGKKVGDELFTPGWTSYQKRIQYQVYDITQQLLKGQNAIGIILGDGWYRGYLVWQGNKNMYGDNTSLILQLKITYQDGSEEIIVSDETWKSSIGPILQSDIYNGETYDARLEKSDWDKPDFNDDDWKKVVIKNHSKEILVSSEGLPVKITEEITPIEKIITPKGELIFDLGQNIVGWIQFKLKGAKGEKITLKHAEVLDEQGNFYIENLRSAKCTDQYIFKGEGIEVYEPHFTFHGFRYVKIEDYPGDISINDIAAKVIHSEMKSIGDFECSDPLINQLQKNIQWGLRGNFLDVPTDCPQRDERLGWTGDAQVFAPTACFNMDAASFYTKWMKDFIIEQKEDGSVPWVVPNVIKDGAGTGWSDGFGSAGWADAVVIIPWTIYHTYGDNLILKNQYNSMKSWVDYMIKHAGERHIFDYGFHYGDWLSFAEYYSYRYNAPDYGYAGANTEKDLIATAYFYYTTSLLHKIARILNKEEDEKIYGNHLPKIKEAFKKEFVTSTGRLTSNTQTAYVLALSFDIMPDEMREIAAKRLADDVEHFGHLTTGFLGTPLICHALTETGYPELAYMLLFNKNYPSWLYPVTKGATTIWERWDGIKPDGSFQDAGMNSFNHYAYGAVGNWLYSKVAGINIDPDHPGYKKIIIKSHFTEKLSFVKAEHHSMYGKIVSHWEIKNENKYLNLVVPVNTSAQIHIPTNNINTIKENNKTLSERHDFQIIKEENGNVVVEVGSGEYSFEFK
ncbi:family 78 glycoside hydrolase catalytic domain [Bacteroidota bacterium]